MVSKVVLPSERSSPGMKSREISVPRCLGIGRGKRRLTGHVVGNSKMGTVMKFFEGLFSWRCPLKLPFRGS